MTEKEELEKAASRLEWLTSDFAYKAPEVYGSFYSWIANVYNTYPVLIKILRSAADDSAGSHDEPGAYETALELARSINGSAVA